MLCNYLPENWKSSRAWMFKEILQKTSIRICLESVSVKWSILESWSINLSQFRPVSFVQAGGSFGELALLYFAPRAVAHLQTRSRHGVDMFMAVYFPYLSMMLQHSKKTPRFSNSNHLVKFWWSFGEVEATETTEGFQGCSLGSFCSLSQHRGHDHSHCRCRCLCDSSSAVQGAESAFKIFQDLSSLTYSTFLQDNPRSFEVPTVSDLSFTIVHYRSLWSYRSVHPNRVHFQELLMKAAHLTVQATMQTMQTMQTKTVWICLNYNMILRRNRVFLFHLLKQTFLWSHSNGSACYKRNVALGRRPTSGKRKRTWSMRSAEIQRDNFPLIWRNRSGERAWQTINHNKPHLCFSGDVSQTSETIWNSLPSRKFFCFPKLSSMVCNIPLPRWAAAIASPHWRPLKCLPQICVTFTGKAAVWRCLKMSEDVWSVMYVWSLKQNLFCHFGVFRGYFSLSLACHRLQSRRYNHSDHRSRKRRIWLLHSSRWLSARPSPNRGNSMKHLWNTGGNTQKREVQRSNFLFEGVSQRSLSMFQLVMIWNQRLNFAW